MAATNDLLADGYPQMPAAAHVQRVVADDSAFNGG
jgi:hypothetical protein